MNAIDLKGVSEKYRIKFVKKSGICWEEVPALDNIDLSVGKGETLGVIGATGAGKTTLLKIIAGMIMPDAGEVNVRGRVSAIMELGAGFNPEFTGRENVALNAGMYGISRKDMDVKLGEIEALADIGRFIDAPIKYYSQGMFMRLAFALAVSVDPDILLVDDILAVGDENAQRKCLAKMRALKESGKTIVLVSHNLDMLGDMCGRIVLLESGHAVRDGSPRDVIPYYLGQAVVPDGQVIVSPSDKPVRKRGRGEIERGDFKLCADAGKKNLSIMYKNDVITRGRGLNGSFKTAGRWYHSGDADWEIAGEDDRSMRVIMAYGPLGSALIWGFSIIDGHTLSVDVSFSGTVPVLTEQYLELELRDMFGRWENAFGSGDIGYSQAVNSIRPVRMTHNKLDNLLVAGDTVTPQVLLKSRSHTGRRVVSLYQPVDSGSLCINSACIMPKTGRLAEKDKSTFFNGEIKVGGSINRADLIEEEECVKIGRGKLCFAFDRGRGRVFFSEKELTSGLGLYTSIRSGGIWFDSCQAAWEAEDVSGTSILVRGDWPHLPVSQRWKLDVVNESEIGWEVHMDTAGQCEIEIEQANIMLSADYAHWMIPGSDQAGGAFPGEFTGDYDIFPFRLWYGLSKSLQAMSAALPGIVFEDKTEGGTIRAVVENTDAFYKARLIQFQRTRTEPAQSGNRLYFKGIIRIKIQEPTVA
ncbi:MAG: ABC transporter ATP-binding protein [Candidatus Omnitrophota bacterium]